MTKDTTSHAGKPSSKPAIRVKDHKDDRLVFYEPRNRTAWYITDCWIDMEDLQ